MKRKVLDDKFMCFDVNDYVYVSPTERGWDVMREHFRDVCENEDEIEETLDAIYRKDKVLVDGKPYYPFQMWQFMKFFGKLLYNGGTVEDSLFNNKIFINIEEVIA